MLSFARGDINKQKNQTQITYGNNRTPTRGMTSRTRCYRTKKQKDVAQSPRNDAVYMRVRLDACTSRRHGRERVRFPIGRRRRRHRPSIANAVRAQCATAVRRRLTIVVPRAPRFSTQPNVTRPIGSRTSLLRDGHPISNQLPDSVEIFAVYPLGDDRHDGVVRVLNIPLNATTTRLAA